MSLTKCHGIIIKQSDFGDANRMLWIFTDNFGIIKAVNRGAGKVRSKTSASSQFLCFGNFEFYSNNDIWTVSNIEGIEPFSHIQEDIIKLSLFTYLADLIYTLLNLNNPDVATLRLLLNSLYAGSYMNISCAVIKLSFELKLMCNQGFAPRTDACVHCGEETEQMYFDYAGGGIACNNCKSSKSRIISDESLEFLRFITECDTKKMFSKLPNENNIKELGEIAENFVLNNTGKKFSSLDYYKMMI